MTHETKWTCFVTETFRILSGLSITCTRERNLQKLYRAIYEKGKETRHEKSKRVRPTCCAGCCGEKRLLQLKSGSQISVSLKTFARTLPVLVIPRP
jgi:hypothetical protein